MKTYKTIECRDWLIEFIGNNPGISAKELLQEAEDECYYYKVMVYKAIKLAQDNIFTLSTSNKSVYYFADRKKLDECKMSILEQVKNQDRIEIQDLYDEWDYKGCIPIAIRELQNETLIFKSGNGLFAKPQPRKIHKSKTQLCEEWLFEYLKNNGRTDVKALLLDANKQSYNRQMIYSVRSDKLKFERVGLKSYWSIKQK